MILKLKRIEEPFQLQVENSRNTTICTDAAESIGGGGVEFRPMELLASGLASCLSIDVLNILKKKKQTPTLFEIELKAIRKDEIPSIFEKIDLEFRVSNEVSEDTLSKTIKLALDKYCSVAKILEPTCEINFSITKL